MKTSLAAARRAGRGVSRVLEIGENWEGLLFFIPLSAQLSKPGCAEPWFDGQSAGVPALEGRLG